MQTEEINIYCDESCHLEHGKEHVMLVSCIYCPKDKVYEISQDLRFLKEKYHLNKRGELKWHKISNCKRDYYIELLNYFLNNEDINFRTIIIPHKEKLKHEIFNQTHSKWYYKMIYTLVKYIPEYIYDNKKKYYVYIDKKENSYEARQEVIKLKTYLDKHFDFDCHIQNIVSDQSELLQLNDFIQGAISYSNRGIYDKEKSNSTKKEIVDMLTDKLGIKINKTNKYKKCNILIWEAKNAE